MNKLVKKKIEVTSSLLGIGSGIENSTDQKKIANSMAEQLKNVYNQQSQSNEIRIKLATVQGHGLFSVNKNRIFSNHLNNKITSLNELNRENKPGNKPATIEAKPPGLKR